MWHRDVRQKGFLPGCRLCPSCNTQAPRNEFAKDGAEFALGNGSLGLEIRVL